jgi:protein involved in polysaccharide export with SLBB domain
VSQQQKDMLDQLPPDQRASILEKMESKESLQTEIDETFKEGESSLIIRPENLSEENTCLDCIFGYDFFQYSPTTFAPVDNTPVPANYVLGPGDKLSINLYGNTNIKIESFVSREGEIVIPSLGPVTLLGMTYSEASDFLKDKVKSELLGTKVSLSLIKIRSINIYVLGQAYKPGKYTVSGLSTISNALFVSGGVNESGSLRNIELNREDKLFAKYDFYELLLRGKKNQDLKLQDGDVIFVPFIENKVSTGGSFKRPGLYEFIEGETVRDAIYLAGGYKSDVNKQSEIEFSYVDSDEFVRRYEYLSKKNLKRQLIDGSTVNVSSEAGIMPEVMKITGEISRPGEYTIRPGDTILDVMSRAGGVTSIGFTEGAVFLRKSVAKAQKLAFERSADELEQTIIDTITKGSIGVISEFTLSPISGLIKRLRAETPPGRMVVDVDRLSLKKDPVKNFRVQDGDVLHIPKRPDSVSVVGEVLSSSTLSFDPEKGVDYYLSLSGGLKDSADKDKIFIIYPNGKSELVKRNLFSSNNILLPGSTVFVSRDPRPFDAINLTQIITPILANLATSAAALAAID